MRITWNELTVSIQHCDSAELLQDWRWLVKDEMQLILVSSVGDMFLANGAGNIFWLDSGFGQLTRVAKNREEFQMLMQQPQNADKWFMPQLVGDLITKGMKLGPEQCFSCQTPPALGGEIQPSNYLPTDLHVHFSVLGQILMQTKDLPENTKIGGVVLKP